MKTSKRQELSPSDTKKKKKQTSMEDFLLLSVNETQKVNNLGSARYDMFFEFKGSKLLKTDMFAAKNQLYFELMKKDASTKQWILIHRSEIIVDSLTPRWSPVKLSVKQSKADEELLSSVKFCCFDRIGLLRNRLVGSFKCKLVELIHRSRHGFPIQLTSDKFGRRNVSGLITSSFTVLRTVYACNSSCTKRNIVLLGTGESGKSTFLRRARMVHGVEYPFSQVEKYTWHSVILSGAVAMTRILLQDFLPDSELNNLPPDLKKVATEIMDSDEDIFCRIQQFLNDSMVDGLSTLWRTKLKELWRKHKFDHYGFCRYDSEVLDNLKEFYKGPDRVTDMHILKTYTKTVGCIDLNLKPNDRISLTITDTGGQRNERRKWPSILVDPFCVLYLVNLSEYPLACYEDDVTNRMHESLECFSSIMKRYGGDIYVRLIFTHADLFKVYLNYRNLNVAFPDTPHHLIRKENIIDVDASYERPIWRTLSRHTSMRDMLKFAFGSSLETFDLSSVSRDVLQHLCTFLSPKHLSRLSMVSNEWYNIANSDHVWLVLCEKYDPGVTMNKISQFYVDHSLSQKTFTPPQESMCKYYFKYLIYSEAHVKFVVDQFLQVIENEQVRELVRDSVMVMNLLDLESSKSQILGLVEELSAE